MVGTEKKRSEIVSLKHEMQVRGGFSLISFAMLQCETLLHSFYKVDSQMNSQRFCLMIYFKVLEAGSFGTAKDSTKLGASAWQRTALSWELRHGEGQH